MSKPFLPFFSNMLLNFILPTFCCGCWRPGNFLCTSCYKQLEFFSSPIKLELESPSIDRVITATHYAWPITNLIHQMKYQNVQDIAKWCGQFLYETIVLPQVDIITFVPLHPFRQRERGFNQSQIIAQTLSQLSGIPCENTLCKIRNSRNQAEIQQRSLRLHNLQQVFHIIEKERCEGKSILLVDDVATTGATLNECAKVLKECGAKEVAGLVVTHGIIQ